MLNGLREFKGIGSMYRILLLFSFVILSPAAYSASKTVLVLGDSLSAEYGLVRGSGWVPLLIERLKAEKLDALIVNASISGETTSGGRSRLQSLLDKHRPNIVIIELGANDGLRGLSISATEENLRAMIAASQKMRAQVLLAGMQIPPNYGPDYTRRFSSMYPKLAKEFKLTLVPFFLEGIADKPQLFQSDRIHPTSEAQPVILNNIWPHLKPLLLK
jgi:acyl-CoA thioesterase-1